LKERVKDLKDRYYSVCRKLVRNRPWAGDEASKAALLSSFQFDKGVECFILISKNSLAQPLNFAERELTRKKYITSLENRTPEQVAEEEALYIEIKKLEQTERRFKKEREDLLRLLGGVDSGLPDVVEDDISSLGQTTTADLKRKKRGALEADSPAPPSSTSISAPILKRPQPAKNAVFGKDSHMAVLLHRWTDKFIYQTLTIASHGQNFRTQLLQPKRLTSLRICVLSSFLYPRQPSLPRLLKHWQSSASRIPDWLCQRVIPWRSSTRFSRLRWL
jgi:hypothetical protein